MIIVEGPDGSGKTTLVNTLLEHPGLMLSLAPRACTSENGAIEKLAEWVDIQLGREGTQRLLYDRFPLMSDFAYGPLIRGYASEKLDDFAWLHSRFNTLKARHRPFVIYCLPPKATVLDNVRGSHKGDTYHLRGVLKHSGAIYDLYVQQAALTPFWAMTWVWDYERDNFGSLCQAIRSHIEH